MAGEWAGFPKNAHPKQNWPIPFFGNPASALVATVGVNPSSEEFATDRNWPAANNRNREAWKTRLKNYFAQKTLSHDWFDPWRIGLALLDCSYEAGTAAHFDVSYSATEAMLKNPSPDSKEFRRMVDRDTAWSFKLLRLCPKLRLLLTMGPIIGENLRPMSWLGFLCDFAPRHGFKVIHNQGFWEFWHEATRKVLVAQDADTPAEKCITCRVVNNLQAHRDDLRQRLA